MKKNLLYYVICWISLVALFNVICFLTPNEMNGLYKFAGAFWSGYGFIMATFVIHLIFSLIVLQVEEQEKKILNIPIIVMSCIELVIMVICGALCMIIPNLPNWVGIIACSTILLFSIILLVAIKNVGENTSKANMKLNAETGFYRELTDTAQLLISSAKSPEVKTIAASVKDAIRYSDPVSSETIHSMDLEIETNLNQLLEMVKADEEVDLIRVKSEELLRVIELRNKKCMSLKRQRV